MSETEVGKVEKYFAKIGVAAVNLERGEISVGDRVKFAGHTTNFEQVVESIQIENQPVDSAPSGSLVGIKVVERVRPGDSLFKVEEET